MSNLTARTYCPRSGSVPARVIAYFQNNLSAKLTNAELALKFEIDAKNTYALLNTAIEANFIARSSGYFTAGDNIDEAPDYGSADQADATIAQARTTPLNAFGAPIKAQPSPQPPKPPQQAKQALPDPTSLSIDDDVPLPSTRGASVVDWKAGLLDRMTVGQSAALPIAAKSTLAKFTARAHKTTSKVFTTRTTSSTELRIWRTA